ncbi:hypothetical protein [Planktothrix agardhii]|uniref:hypothetical protein n=2 Tax=Microcoleaceae TaxID=1892252 RepID=UPI0011437978|nr:hypothetical protein [Planktothrix agardhii]
MVIESKPARLDVTTGIPQALTYLLNAPNLQSSCYGMVTNQREVLFLKCDRHQSIPQYFSIAEKLFRLFFKFSLFNPPNLEKYDAFVQLI